MPVFTDGAGKAQSIWLLAARQRDRSLSPNNVKCSHLHNVETGSRAHPASYPVGATV
jgi:hypothetical protein